jgi:hypothetical protein
MHLVAAATYLKRYAPQMSFATPQFAQEVTALMSSACETPSIDEEALAIGRQLGALPIGFDFAFHFVRPDGTVISCDPPHAPEFSNDQQRLICAIVYASRSYPSLVRFIPQRPAQAPDCAFCSGTGVKGLLIGSNKAARCPICAGLGWTVSGA